jgi:hypothetical protein
MNAKILTVKLAPDGDSLEVWMSIGEKQHQFTFSRKFDSFANRQLQIITYDKEFGEIFKFNQHIIGEVLNLVRQFYKGDNLELPASVGDFGTPEEALALQKPFVRSKVVENVPTSVKAGEGN